MYIHLCLPVQYSSNINNNIDITSPIRIGYLHVRIGDRLDVGLLRMLLDVVRFAHCVECRCHLSVSGGVDGVNLEIIGDKVKSVDRQEKYVTENVLK